MSAFSMSNATVRCEKLVLVQTGTYQDQAIRSFEVDVNQAVISSLIDVTRGGMNLGVSAVQDIAGQIIAPSAVTEGYAAITNGWAARRFRGMLRVREEHPVMKGTSTQRIFYLYTDGCDISHGNKLDPQMRVYFNSETVINEAYQQTVNGLQRTAKVVSSNQIVTPMDMMATQGGMFNQATAHLMRPTDLYAHGQTEAVCERLQASGRFQGSIASFHDHRTMIGECGAFQYSQREDTSPVRYISNTLGAFGHATKEAAMLNDDNHGNSQHNNKEFLFSEAQSYTANASIHANTFLARLKENAGYMSRGYVTWADLCGLFPELTMHGITEVGMDTGTSRRQVMHREDSDHFIGSDDVSIAAATLAQTVPSLMMDTFLRTVTLAVTNSYGQSASPYSIQIFENGCRTIMDNISMKPYMLEFERRMVIDALNTITFSGNRQHQISISSDLAGDTIIDISLDGQPSVRYVTPTFTDALNPPVLTRDKDRSRKIANDMLYLVQEVVPNQGNRAAAMGMFDPNAFMAAGGGPVEPSYADYVHPSMGTINAGPASHQNAYDFGGL